MVIGLFNIVIAAALATTHIIEGVEQSLRFSASLATEVLLEWDYSDDDIILKLIVPTTGWIGIGFSEDGSMTGADIIVAGISDGEPYVLDAYGDRNGPPLVDASQDVDIFDAWQNETHTAVSVVRRRLSFDDQDNTIYPGWQHVIWAFGGRDISRNKFSFGNYHRRNRGSAYLELIQTENVDLVGGVEEWVDATTVGETGHMDWKENVTTVGDFGHIEWVDNATAVGDFGHIEWIENATAVGDFGHIEWIENATAVGDFGHIEGVEDPTTAAKDFGYMMGLENTTVVGDFGHINGAENATAVGDFVHNGVENATAVGDFVHNGVENATAVGDFGHIEGVENATTAGDLGHRDWKENATTAGEFGHIDRKENATTAEYARHTEWEENATTAREVEHIKLEGNGEGRGEMNKDISLKESTHNDRNGTKKAKETQKNQEKTNIARAVVPSTAFLALAFVFIIIFAKGRTFGA